MFSFLLVTSATGVPFLGFWLQVSLLKFNTAISFLFVLSGRVLNSPKPKRTSNKANVSLEKLQIKLHMEQIFKPDVQIKNITSWSDVSISKVQQSKFWHFLCCIFLLFQVLKMLLSFINQCFIYYFSYFITINKYSGFNQHLTGLGN